MDILKNLFLRLYFNDVIIQNFSILSQQINQIGNLDCHRLMQILLTEFKFQKFMTYFLMYGPSFLFFVFMLVKMKHSTTSACAETFP